MEYVYATLTLTETDAEINEANLTAVLEAAGAEVVESRVKAIVAALEDLDLAAIGAEAGIEPAFAAAAAPPAVADDADAASAVDDAADEADEATDAEDATNADDPTDADDESAPVASDGGREDEDR